MCPMKARATSPDSPPETLAPGAYEVLRGRVASAAAELGARLAKLNAARKAVFGAIEMELTGTARVTTDHNCVPRDITPVGHTLVFGYNVQMGLKSTTAPEDVLAAYQFKDHSFSRQALDLFSDERFRREFEEVYKYYRKATFNEFFRLGPYLYLVFRVGKDARDVKAFKWHCDGERLVYVDNRSDHEYRFPPQHGFEWLRAHRGMHRQGLCPHVSIEDRLFVETVGGDLTIKIENNTESGQGIYAEPVDNPDQTLDDAEYFYAIVGNLILLKIRPYQEPRHRYYVYCEKTRQAVRLDAVEDACVLLPEDQGLIFAGGYFLQTGHCKTFEAGLSPMVFRERIASPNGEDFLYVFYNGEAGLFILLPYNMIEQKVDTPVVCNGFSLFDDGTLVYFKTQEEPQRHHTLQIWQTPFAGVDFQPPAAQCESFLYRVGNQDLVRGMAECREVLDLAGKEDSYAGLFVDLAKKTADLLDTYYWLAHDEAFNLREPLLRIREAADAAIGEFEKVTSLGRGTQAQVGRVAGRARQVASAVKAKRFEAIGDFVGSLVDLRSLRGEAIALRSLPYIDAAQVDALEKEVGDQTQQIGRRAAAFLLDARALEPYRASVQEQREAIGGLEKLADAKRFEERLAATAHELETLVEVVSNLKIDDATQRTAIVEAISAIFSQLNQVRSGLRGRMQELARREGAAEFASQLKLIGQGMHSYLDVCDSPQKCEEYLTKMMIQVEEIEGRFAGFDEFLEPLAEKRQEIYSAFEARKVQLLEARNRRATALASAADRILKGIKARVDSLKTLEEIHGYFAANLMVQKLRDTIAALAELGDSVKVDDLQSRLKTLQEDAVRQLKDRQDLYEDGENVIRLGEHRFLVNRQAFDLTTVLRDGQMYFHLSGSNYFDRIEDPQLLATRDVWQQELVSESADVYRGEYLAYRMLQTMGDPEARRASSDGWPSRDEAGVLEAEELLALVQRFMAPRYSEGYAKGVHDHDGALILARLLKLDAASGLLRYHPQARALARVQWMHFVDPDRKKVLANRIRGLGTVGEVFPGSGPDGEPLAELEALLRSSLGDGPLFPEHLAGPAAEYLLAELAGGRPMIVSRAARDLCQRLEESLARRGLMERYCSSVAAVHEDPRGALVLYRKWLAAFLAADGGTAEPQYLDEAAAVLATGERDEAPVLEVPTAEEIVGLVGNHPRIDGRRYRLDLPEFLLRLGRYCRETAPRFETFGRVKQELLAAERQRLKLEEFRPRVLTTFVRNRLIDEVYLPLIGGNLAKQLGEAGEQKRTDRMGMLLLISPPGYGKTTLMEYVANRLGLVFMKINGPALGHRVTSLDPAEAPNAAAREEIQKLNLALEMGDNVMLYLDDIQHCNAELLQKFISLCDAQRKIEGVWRGRTRTYDLRGKKVAVVMAGNPYTESGQQFKIPDMLANRADVYNLGEILGSCADRFRASYLENALTSNPVLARLARGPAGDVYAMIRAAEDGSARVEMEGHYAGAEVEEMLAVMRKLVRVRDVVLRVNEEYIRSAGIADDYRTEPPFKLQGSYRNMNRIAERVVAVMNDAELEELILGSYQSEAQTLTTGAESNLLKFKELIGRLAPDEAERWEDIKRTFTRNVKLRGVGEGEDARFAQLLVQLGTFADGLEGIDKTLRGSLERLLAAQSKEPPALRASLDGEALAALGQVVQGLREALAERPAAPPGPQEIHVVSKVPMAILQVLRNQFRLLEGWLQPLRQESLQQREEHEALRALLTEAAASYKSLIALLEDAARRSDAPYDQLAVHKLQVDRPKRRPKA